MCFPLTMPHHPSQWGQIAADKRDLTGDNGVEGRTESDRADRGIVPLRESFHTAVRPRHRSRRGRDEAKARAVIHHACRFVICQGADVLLLECLRAATMPLVSTHYRTRSASAGRAHVQGNTVSGGRRSLRETSVLPTRTILLGCFASRRSSSTGINASRMEHTSTQAQSG